MHIACAKARKNRLHQARRADPDYRIRERASDRQARAQRQAARYESDPEYRARVDVIAKYSVKGRPPREARMIRVLWARYRLRESDFLRLLAWQNNSCPCGDPFRSLYGKQVDTPHVDHGHRCCPGGTTMRTCGKCIRGLLHGQCNRLIGVIEANPNVIQPVGWAAKYLGDPPYQQMLRATS